ncbi:MAG: photosystem I reaction center protein subunit XI [Synechococcus sp. MED-G71]|jgi:photosystem I subunit 11|nr:MAG: photosystem I reaction center protein subunit XI [Synechococcus sp. MED-G71]RPF76118.1 MAG: photosystem I reaction center protein subunit XI [Synechococcus sp. TMED155]|tara:strand:+ start:3255 stop:3746 length:492 start_codon:yes stop_codon:yes gene_type:complete
MTVTPVADPCVGNLATPVNSGYFIKALINNLPFYRSSISPNFRGLETGAAFGYLLYGPFTICGPLRNSELSSTAGLLAAVGAVHILTLLLLLYNQPGRTPYVPQPDVTVENPPTDLFTRTGWADFTSGFWLGGCGGAAFAWFLCSTPLVEPLVKIAGGVWSVG